MYWGFTACHGHSSFLPAVPGLPPFSTTPPVSLLLVSSRSWCHSICSSHKALSGSWWLVPPAPLASFASAYFQNWAVCCDKLTIVSSQKGTLERACCFLHSADGWARVWAREHVLDPKQVLSGALCFLAVAGGINLVFLSALCGLLQNFNLLHSSVEIKAFWWRLLVFFFQEESLPDEAVTMKQSWSETFCWGSQAQQGFGEQPEQRTSARAAGVRWGAWSLPCSCRCWTASEGKAVFSRLFFLHMYKERKLTYVFKKPRQSFRGTTECNRECPVCKIVLAEKLAAANSPLKRTGFWEVHSSLVHQNNE